MSYSAKLKGCFSRILKSIKRAWLFPHIRICFAILAAALVMLLCAYVLDQCGIAFWSSICANIFAGLITGLVLCFVSGIKQRKIMTMQLQKKWLEDLSALLRTYMTDYHNLRKMKFEKYSSDDDKLFDFIYDVGVHANDVNTMILQSTFDKTIAFKPCAYCKQKFDYDAEGLIDAFEELHDNLYMVDITCDGSKKIVSSFDTVHPHLSKLNSSVHSAIRELEVDLAEIQRTII